MTSWIRLFRTSESVVLPVLRVGLALVILPHGLQKTLGWFGGFGFRGTMDFFTGTMELPYALGLAAVTAESLGAVLVLVGLGTRLWAAMIGVTMLVAMVTVHLQHGFFMNWFGTQSGEGGRVLPARHRSRRRARDRWRGSALHRPADDTPDSGRRVAGGDAVPAAGPRG